MSNTMLFMPLKPMEPTAAALIPKGDRYLYQIKWDGVRMVAHIGAGKVWLHNRKLRERTSHYPELGRLAGMVNGDAILDGEIVAVRDGKPSFPLVLERDLIKPASAGSEKMRRLISQVPVFYMVFDILLYNGKVITDLPLLERQAILADALPQDDIILPVESFGDGDLLFSAVKDKRMEGIVAKEKTAPYQLGKKHSSWQKIKYRPKQLVAIGGYTVKGGQVNALLAGAYYEGRFVYLGRIATGLTGRDIAALTPFLKGSSIPIPPFMNASPGKDKVWVTPRLTALVSYQEWTDDLRMRQPVIEGFTKDAPEDCIVE